MKNILSSPTVPDKSDTKWIGWLLNMLAWSIVLAFAIYFAVRFLIAPATHSVEFFVVIALSLLCVTVLYLFCKRYFLTNENAARNTNFRIESESDWRTKVEEELAYRSDFQDLIAKLAIYFFDLTVENIHQGMTHALRMLSEFLHVDRCLVLLIDNDSSTFKVAYEYSRTGISPLRAANQNIPIESISWLIDKHLEHRIINFPDIADLPPEARQLKDSFRAAGVKSFIAIPLIQRGKLIGFLCQSYINDAGLWSHDEANQLVVLGQIIVGLLERHAFEENLRTQTAQLNMQAERLSILHNLDQLIFSSSSLQDLAEQTLMHLQELTNCKCNSILLIDYEDCTGNFLAHYPNGDDDIFERSMPLAAIDYLSELQDGIVILHDQIEMHPPDSFDRQWAEHIGLQSMAHYPLMSHSKLIGILHLGFEESEGVATLNFDLIDSVASSLSLAIANTQLHTQVQVHSARLAIEVAERTATLERQFERQAALAKIELAINQPAELQNVLERVVEVTTASLPADIGVSIILWNTESNTFALSASSVAGQEAGIPARRARKSGGATRWIIDQKKPLLVSDINNDPFGANPMLKEYSVGAYAGIPLLIEEGVIGVLYALMSGPTEFAEEEVEFLTTVARRAALAVTKVQLFEKAQVIAAESERQRIARDLHDVVSQSLFSASVIAESLPKLFDKRPELVRTGLADIHQLTKGSLAEVRTLLFELRPNALLETELNELMSQLTEAFSGRTGIPVALSFESEMDLSSGQQIGVYRVAQEALSNIARHARAQQVWIEYRHDKSGYILRIRDDGIGFNPDEIPSGHLGLQIMHERANEINAHLTIESSPSMGTSVVLSYPPTLPNTPKGANSHEYQSANPHSTCG